ncbi:hypothetical protein AMTRI_Chr01g102560 [Amborella trichopoda]
MKNIYYFLPTLNNGFQYSGKWGLYGISRQCSTAPKHAIGQLDYIKLLFEFLFQWEVNEEVVIRFFKWPDKENGCRHNVKLLLQAASLVAKWQKYDKIRPFLHFMVKRERQRLFLL